MSSSAGDTPLSKGELTRIKNRRKKNKTPIGPDDEPGYVAKVEKERAILALNNKQTKKREEGKTPPSAQ